MSILITGGGGFLGSHLAEELVSRGEKVRIVDDFSRGSRNNLENVKDEAEIIDADLRDRDAAMNAVEGCEKVYHLAARIGGVGYLRDKPAEIIADNDEINRNVFDACVEEDIERVLFASSSMLYSETDKFPSEEKDVEKIPPPRGSYGFQKLNGEYYCDAYQREHGLEYVSVRIFNGIGPRDWPEEEVGHGHVIPDMVKKIVELEQHPVKVKGSGEQTRCFTDVRDLIEGMIKAMETPEARNESFNLGTTNETSINELVKKIWAVSNREEELEIETEKSFSKDVKKRVPCIEKSKEVLNWEPKYSLKESLENYIKAYREEFM